jgi:ABC-type transporter Mla MlaB component
MAGASPETIIRLPPQFTIRTIEEVCRRFEEALKGAGTLRVDVSDVTKIDTAGLQLLLAIKMELASHQTAPEWLGTNATIDEAAAIAGLTGLLNS